nr:MAG TPA: hypothetical protein [Caudoviricetes sp.]
MYHLLKYYYIQNPLNCKYTIFYILSLLEIDVLYIICIGGDCNEIR